VRVEGRVRAPELRGAGGWLNTGGRELSLAGLRGRIVLLDFWTSACANCLHVIDELRPLEARYADVLTTIGVHSPKFPHEAEHAAVAAAVQRYDVRHPVLDDPDLATWRQYAINAWPTLVLVDPDGYVVATRAGEGHTTALAGLIDGLVARYGDRLRRGDDPYVPPDRQETTLRFPGGIAVTPAGTLLVADAGHHSVVELAPDGETLLRRIGSGRRGRADGGAEKASFAEPQGVAVLPPGALPGVDVLVADTANHLIRGVRLETGEVSTVADLPAALAGVRTITGPVPGVLSPWDVAWWDGRVAVAAAGVHLLLAVDPATRPPSAGPPSAGSASAGSPSAGPADDRDQRVNPMATVLAGTTVEGLRDGPALDGWLAQPSALAPDGARLWFADAETSALRTLEAGALRTHVGEGLFDFGLVDGPAGQARFQHPLGVTLLPDGAVAVLDTYNGAVRRYDPRDGIVDTLATGLAEPTGAVVQGDELVVVESAAHRLTRVPLRRTLEIGTGPVTVAVTFVPPPGEELDDRYGPSTSLKITGLAPGPSLGPDLIREITVAAESRLSVSAYAASCDEQAEHPACHLARREWDLRVTEGGPARVELVLDAHR
jgi:thiol-disulfide isomerase/thioredoxin